MGTKYAKKVAYGAGISTKQFDKMVANIVGQLDIITQEWYAKTCAVLMRHARSIAKLSRHQFDALENAVFTGRVKQVRDLLQKTRLYGLGIMAAHLVPKTGVSANTFAGMDPQQQSTLNNGTVKISTRGGVRHVKSRMLTDKELQIVIASWRSKVGPKLLDPAQQSKPKGREDPELHSPDMSSMRLLRNYGLRICCHLNDHNVVVKFTADEILEMADFLGLFTTKKRRKK